MTRRCDYTTAVQTRACEVLIIGAGPAGSVAATALARRGVDCLIVEQSRFPREKVCGECLSAVGVDVLRRLGLLDSLLRSGARWLDRALLHAMDGAPATIALRRPMLGISRGTMDQILLQAAIDSGAQVRQPARCEKVDQSGAAIRCLVTNQMTRILPRQIVVADGKGATGLRRPSPSGDLGVKAHLGGVDAPAGTIELFGGRGFYGGLAPIEGDRWNIAIAVSKAILQSCGGSSQRVFERLQTDCPALHARTRNARLLGDWHASPLPRFQVRSDWQCSLIPAGNALSAIEPIGGEGMGMAMRSAECIASAIAAGGSGGVDRLELLSRVRTVWSVRGWACRAAARVISTPALARHAVRIARAAPGFAAQWARLAGK